MAEKRTRTTSTQVVTPNKDTIKTPTEKVEQNNQYDSILQIVEEQNKKLQKLDEENKVLTKKVAEASWDISEQVKESKRKYWYNIDWTRKADELFKYRYNCLLDDNKEKVVIKTQTIWRPINIRNDNTGKWANQHNLEVTFHDDTKTTIDVLDYINQKFQYEEFIADKDIEVIDGKKNYTFHTEKFWTFTMAENFIN